MEFLCLIPKFLNGDFRWQEESTRFDLKYLKYWLDVRGNEEFLRENGKKKNGWMVDTMDTWVRYRGPPLCSVSTLSEPNGKDRQNVRDRKERGSKYISESTTMLSMRLPPERNVSTLYGLTPVFIGSILEGRKHTRTSATLRRQVPPLWV